MTDKIFITPFKDDYSVSESEHGMFWTFVMPNFTFEKRPIPLSLFGKTRVFKLRQLWKQIVWDLPQLSQRPFGVLVRKGLFHRLKDPALFKACSNIIHHDGWHFEKISDCFLDDFFPTLLADRHKMAGLWL